MRLDKAIANNTSYSRKDVNKIIKKGFVKVNDKTIIDSTFKIDIQNDIIKINDKIVTIYNKFYIALNKPKIIFVQTQIMKK